MEEESMGGEKYGIDLKIGTFQVRFTVFTQIYWNYNSPTILAHKLERNKDLVY
jgi:hypothetical protein